MQNVLASNRMSRLIKRVKIKKAEAANLLQAVKAVHPKEKVLRVKVVLRGQNK